MEGKKALVLGLGISGRAATRLLLSKRVSTFAVDDHLEKIKDLPDIIQLLNQGLQIADASIDMASFDEVIVSPGIPPSTIWMQKAIEAQVPLIGEAQLAFRELPGHKMIAITGTNGKTTVTSLCEHVLKSCGVKARALGNIGTPLSDYVLSADSEEVIVAELSSYQLETMEGSFFDAAILLNITPDHLDRYASMDEYARAKCRLQGCMKPSAPLYVFGSAAREYGAFLSKGYATFGVCGEDEYGTDGKAIYRGEKVALFYPIGYEKKGMHESINALAAWLLCKDFGVDRASFVHALESFIKPSHRIEFVAEVDGVSYYDDSKGTNLDAVIQAVGTMNGPVVLIAGGVDKGASYLLWKDPFYRRVKHVFALGQAAQKIYQELSPYYVVEVVPSLSAAVEGASKIASEGDSVLLSPGCSSFDMFRDYAHRGEEFQKSVNMLVERKKTV